MKQVTKDKAVWSLNQLDKTYKFTSEYLKDVIYLSDARFKTCIALDVNNPDHTKYFKIIERLNKQAEKYKYDVSVFHVIIGEYEFPNERVWMENYLFVTDEDEFYKDNFTEYGCVMAHVENEAWDVSESGSIRVINKDGVLYRTA